jgi:dUTP pyrophosphatase
MVRLKIQKLDAGLPTPSYGYKGDAAFDMFAKEEVTLKSGERQAIPTGLALEIPEGYVGLIWDKSGIGIKEGIKTLGGVVDATYRGEIMVGMVNLSDKEYTFERGHKVAQMIIQKKEDVQIDIVDALCESERGIDGFGSTGK